MALVGLLQKGDVVGDANYMKYAMALQKWCSISSLGFNQKTKSHQQCQTQRGITRVDKYATCCNQVICKAHVESVQTHYFNGSLWSFWPLVVLWSCFLTIASQFCLCHTHVRRCTCRHACGWHDKQSNRWCRTIPLINRWWLDAKIFCNAPRKTMKKSKVIDMDAHNAGFKIFKKQTFQMFYEDKNELNKMCWVHFFQLKDFNITCLFPRKLQRAPFWTSQL